MEARKGDRRIILEQGDITHQAVDAVVNAANSALQLGSGVAGAIRRGGGPRIQEECDAIGGAPVGSAVITTGGELAARHVIHAVGPRMGQGDEDQRLGSAVRAALRVAAEHELGSIALPAISTGVFGFPLDRCAQICVATALDFRSENAKPSEIRFVLFTPVSLTSFEAALRRETMVRPGWRLIR